MNDTLSLATRLRSLDDRMLVDTLRTRTVSTGGVDDFFDLAEALLDRASVQQALIRLDRRQLAALATAADLAADGAPAAIADVAATLGLDPETVVDRLGRPADLLLADLVDGRVTVYSGVAQQLESWPVFGLPSSDDLARDSGGRPPAPLMDGERQAIDRLAAEHAFTAT